MVFSASLYLETYSPVHWVQMEPSGAYIPICIIPTDLSYDYHHYFYRPSTSEVTEGPQISSSIENNPQAACEYYLIV